MFKLFGFVALACVASACGAPVHAAAAPSANAAQVKYAGTQELVTGNPGCYPKSTFTIVVDGPKFKYENSAGRVVIGNVTPDGSFQGEMRDPRSVEDLQGQIQGSKVVGTVTLTTQFFTCHQKMEGELTN